MKMRSNNKGLTVKVNLWALEKYLDKFYARKARLWICGQVSAEGKKPQMFHDAGQLITILGKWNVEQFQKLKKAKRAAKKQIRTLPTLWVV
jgi:hypothetical protein